MSPAELLQRYAQDHDQAAFSLFVQQHFDLVYSAALRQAAHDSHLARDIAQSVFAAVAQHAASLSRHPALTGWLYTTTRYQTAKYIQAQRRWQAREQKAHDMENSSTSSPPADELWRQLRPVVDDALHALSIRDREAILLRYFEDNTFSDIARRLGLSENTTRMRVDRALEKLRGHLVRRGLTSTAAAIGAALSTNIIQAAPAGLAIQTAVTIHQTTVPASLLSSLLFKLHLMNSLKLAALSVSFATIVGYGLMAATSTPTHVEEITVTRLQSSTSISAQDTSTTNPPQPAQSTSAKPAKNREPKPSNELLFLRFEDKIHLTDTVIKRFDLTPAETDKIQTDIKHAWDELDAFAAQNASLQIPAPGTAVITITPFSQGADIYEQLLTAIGHTLGATRNQQFFDSTASALEHNLKYCGATTRTFTVTKTFNGQGEFLEYEVTDTWTSAYQRKGKGTRRYKNRAAFAQDYPHLAKLLPADFR